MNILFLTLLEFESLQDRNIYTDLLREFVKNGHNVFAVSPVEKRRNIDTHLIEEDHARILRIKIGNTQKTNIVEKGISTVMIEPIFRKAIRRFFSTVKFDLVLYSTPPITFVSAIDYVKKRDGATTYLLLKDIFPQNAIDIGILSKKGIKGVLYNYFRKKEKKLYRMSDHIGCMSQANVDYVIKNNPEINTKKVEICPNSIEVIDKSVGVITRNTIREKYKIPLNKTVFVYGGNLGRPQGILFLIECLICCRDIKDAFFLIVGDGTEYNVIREYIKKSEQKNVRLMRRLPKEDYDLLVGACDVGMVFLDYRFTIPNFPSRVLSYMQSRLPVFAITDKTTDMGKIIVNGGFGWWCESREAKNVEETVQSIINNKKRLKEIGDNSYSFLQEHYNVNDAYKTVANHLRRDRDKVAIINSVFEYGSTGSLAKELFEYGKKNNIETFAFYGRGRKVKDRNILRIDSPIEVYIHKALSLLTGFQGCYSNLATSKLIKRLKKEKIRKVILLNIHGYYINEKRLLLFLKNNGIKTAYVTPDEYAGLGKCCYNGDCELYKTECGKCPKKKDYPKSLLFDRSHNIYCRKKESYRGFDKLVLIGPESNIIKFQKSPLVQRKKMRSIPWGIDLKVYKNYTDEEIYERYNIPRNKIIILTVAQYSNPRKGVKEYFFEIARRLINTEYHFINVGYDGDLLKSEIPPNMTTIRYIDNQEELARIYSISDMYLLASTTDTMPLSCLIAFACETPVCCFYTSGLMYLAEEDSLTIRYCHQISVDALENEIRKVGRKNIETRKACRLLAEKKYSIGAFCRNVYDALNNC